MRPSLSGEEGGGVLRFYYSADWQAKNLNVPNVLVSASMILDRPTTADNPPSDMSSVMVDCGAFSDKQLSILEYKTIVALLKEKGWPVDYVATQDVIGDWQKTAEQGINCFTTDIEATWMPVLQGPSLNRYLLCLGQYQDMDIEADLWAVGGLKLLSRDMKRRTLSAVSKLVPRVHGFGLTLKDLEDPVIWSSIWSTDSGTWKFGRNGMPNTNQEKFENLRLFCRRLELLEDSYSSQTILDTPP